MMHALAFLCVVLQMLASAQASAQYFIIAPNVIRVDVDETILVSVLGTPDGVRVPVTLYFEIESNQRISETTVSVTNDDPQEATLRISRDQLIQPESRGQQFITLVASASTAHLQIQDRRTILLSYQAGFVFIQTDKPLYTPGQRVNIRVVALDQNMIPAGHELQVDIANPDQIIVHRYNKMPQKGFLTLQFDFPPLPTFGNWTVIAYYGHQFKAQTSVQFEVKEYVLPKFNVKVDTGEKYIVPETVNLISTLTARYVFGEPVSGSFFVSFGVFEDDGTLTILQEKEGKLNDQGKGIEDLVMADVTVRDWAETLMGKSLLIQAFVTDRASGETINVNNTMVTFSTTPYKFSWDLTQKYFKRGLPFAVKANLQFMSGLPATGIHVTVSATARLPGGVHALEGAQGNDGQEALDKVSGSQGEVDFRLDVPSDAELVTITLETKDPALIAANMHSILEVQPQQSNSGEYLVVRLQHGEVRQTQMIGTQSSIEVQLTHPERVEILNYFVIAGGKIVHKGTKQLVNLNTALGFLVTHNMAPSSRVVAYYASTSGDIIADALFIEVEESCSNPIGLSFKGLPSVENTFKMDNGSNKNIELQVKAKEGTTVALLAVDEAVFILRNYHRLTQKKVFKRMAGYDLGCGPGGGQTSATIFKDAGVTVMTNANLNVAGREVMGCPGDAKRRRRSVNETEKEQILNRYEGVEREYCEKGLRELLNPEDTTCTKRANQLAKRKRIDPESPEIAAFYECCLEFESISRGRANVEDGGGVNLDQTTMVRSNFPESWMFTEVETGVDDSVSYQATLPDTVTTWVIEAVGVSEDYGMCVADPVKLQVRPPFFLDIGMPYSVQRFEQIEIIVSVFNYAEVVLQVTVYLKGVEGLCSEAQPGSYSTGKAIAVLPKKPASVKFIIIPLVIKRLPIEVVAVTNSSKHYRDAVRKFLTVRPEGYEQKDIVTGILDPANSRESRPSIEHGGLNQSFQHDQFWGAKGETNQVNIIRYELNGGAIPDTHQVHVSLMGDVMGSVVETVIGGLDKLLRIPSGCGEQTMLGLAPNVYIYTYLKRSLPNLPAALEPSAKKYIEDGVKRELTFRRPDGSFTVWPKPEYPSSTWLTAFVTKVMCRAKEFALVDDNIICKAMEWLITQTHTDPRDGSFTELYKVHHKEMTGGVQGKVSLTAYVLISLLECECDTINKDESVAEAVVFLELELPALTRPYAIAITAYALVLANSIDAQDAIVKLKDIAKYDEASGSRYWGADDSSFGAGSKPYWYSRRPKAIEVETTSYALLALLEMDDIQYTHAIVNWLTNQENYNGGFVSTQDTVMGLQALSAYAARVQQYNIDMTCKVTNQESDFSETFMMQTDNAIIRQSTRIKTPEWSPKFTVNFITQGSGMGQFKFEATYYIPEPDNSQCDFELVINEDQVDPDEDGKEFTYDIRVRYLREEATGMAIVDVGLYTGYEPNMADLKDVVENDGRIQRYELTDRSVIFYLDDIQRAEVTRLTFRTERKFYVGKAQPVAVRVYDYYNPTVECVKFINPGQGSNMLSTLCAGDVCTCAAGKCSHEPYNKERDFNVFNMKAMACESTAHFAYEVHVDSQEERGSFLFYNVTILVPLKLGLDPVYQGKKRTFWKSKNCDTPEIKNRNYLVIGSGGLATKDKMGNSMYKYIIDERMSFFAWPTPKQIQKIKKWNKIVKILREFKMDLVDGNGCPT